MPKSPLKNLVRRQLQAFIGVFSLVLCPLVALAEASNTAEQETAPFEQNQLINKIEALSNRILLQEIEFERTYTEFRQNSLGEPKWRHLRYFLCQDAGAGLFVGSEATSLAETAKHIHSPLQVRNHVLTGGLQAGLIGSALAGGSSAFELCSNGLTAIKYKLSGRDPETVRRQLVAVSKELTDLINQRSELVEQAPDSVRELYRKEGSVLRSFRDWCIYEFATIYADSKSFQSSNNAYYLLSAAGLSLFIVSYAQAIHGYRHPNYFGPSAISGTIGSSIGMVSTPVSMLCYKKLYSYWFKKLSKQLNQRIFDNESDARNAMLKLETELKVASEAKMSGTEHLTNRLALCGLWADRYDDLVDKEQRELRRLQKVSLQNAFAGPLIYGSFLGQDIVSDVAAYRLPHNPTANNTSAMAGSIAPTFSSALSVALTTGWFALDEIEWGKLRKRNELPSQLIERRLVMLDDLKIRLLNRD